MHRRPTYVAPTPAARARTRLILNWPEIAATVAVCVIVVVLTLWGVHVATAQDVPAWDSLPQCPTEDSDNCRWDAHLHGNGDGRSFVTVDQVTHYDDGEVVAWETER
jgi:hypothetical protein